VKPDSKEEMHFQNDRDDEERDTETQSSSRPNPQHMQRHGDRTDNDCNVDAEPPGL
jgi:hypothetical protein